MLSVNNVHNLCIYCSTQYVIILKLEILMRTFESYLIIEVILMGFIGNETFQQARARVHYFVLLLLFFNESIF